MASIDDAVKQLKEGDVVRVRYRAAIQIHGPDTFVGTYVKSDEDKKTMTVKKTVFDASAVKMEIDWALAYDKIDSLERMSPEKLFEK
jgi:hypothetical protein